MSSSIQKIESFGYFNIHSKLYLISSFTSTLIGFVSVGSRPGILRQTRPRLRQRHPRRFRLHRRSDDRLWQRPRCSPRHLACVWRWNAYLWRRYSIKAHLFRVDAFLSHQDAFNVQLGRAGRLGRCDRHPVWIGGLVFAEYWRYFDWCWRRCFQVSVIDEGPWSSW